jgi:hypothetical protein
MAGILIWCTSCNDNTRNEPEGAAREIAKDTELNNNTAAATPILLDGCYRMVAKMDTINMRLNVIDSFVTGDLSYHLYAKDQNEGSVKGVLRDSMIIAQYTFRSEGMLSVRQVAFKMAGSALVEGFGDLDTKRDTMRFKDVSKLTFNYERPFNKVPCTND